MILQSPTNNKSITEIDNMKRSNNSNILTLPEHKDNYYEQNKEILVKHISKRFHKNNKMNSILPSPTDSRSIRKIDETKVSNNMNMRTLLEYKDKSNKQHKEIFVKKIKKLICKTYRTFY